MAFRRDDLFVLFPDLPRLRTRSRSEQVARMRRLLLDTRDRAAVNVERQKEASARVREAVLARQQRGLATASRRLRTTVAAKRRLR